MRLFIVTFLAIVAAAATAVAQQDPTPRPQDDLPTVVTRVNPKYPMPPPADSAEGTVHVKMLIDAQGKVAKAWTLKSDVAASLTDEALKAARQWTFEPSKKGASIEVVVPFRFKLSHDKKK